MATAMSMHRGRASCRTISFFSSRPLPGPIGTAEAYRRAASRGLRVYVGASMRHVAVKDTQFLKMIAGSLAVKIISALLFAALAVIGLSPRGPPV